MGNLTDFAKEELELIHAFDEEGDFYGGMTGKAVMELIEVFSKQGHSGMSANLVRQLFNTLAQYKPISKLTLSDDEWNEVNEVGDNTYQNKRNPAVFKEGITGKPYYIDAFYMKDQNGSTFTGSLPYKGHTIIKCYIKDTANMPTIKIDVVDDGDDYKIVYETQVEELMKYYELEIE